MKIKIHFCRSDSLIPYLKSGEWQITNLSHHLETKNKASIVNRLSLPEFGDVIVKTTIVSSSFSFARRIEQRLRFILVKPTLRDAECAAAALKLGIDTYTPLAVWDTCNHNTVSSHILYTFIDGAPLLDIYNKTKAGIEPKENFLKILSSLGSIARKLHDGGIIHKDLAPRNILIRPNGKPALIDFASGYKHSHKKGPLSEATLHYSLVRLLRTLNEEEITIFSQAYTQNDPNEKKSRTLKQLLFWQKHSLKGRGGIHFFSHLIDLIKAASIH